jgi:hypothetical protein
MLIYALVRPKGMIMTNHYMLANRIPIVDLNQSGFLVSDRILVSHIFQTPRPVE